MALIEQKIDKHLADEASEHSGIRLALIEERQQLMSRMVGAVLVAVLTQLVATFMISFRISRKS